MGERFRFSVIVPVYNSAKTIRRCLDSMLSQKREDIQLILVNDGSKDESGTICLRYVEKYPYICFYEKENGGVSSARNLGLEHAEGKYVLFVDSDDYVAEHYFEVIDCALKDDSPDLLLFGNFNTKKPDQPMNCYSFSSADREKVSEFATKLMLENRFNALWVKCFSNEIIQKNELRFDEKTEIAEDLQFIFSFMMYASSVKATPKAVYYVDVSNQDSLSRKNRPDLGKQLMYSTLSMKNALDRATLSITERKHYAQAISRMFYRSVYSAARELCKSNVTSKDRRKQLRQICREYANQSVPAVGLHNKIIAAPVRLSMVHLIDGMARGRLS